jgi:phosphohistidine phosphatase
MTFKTLYLCRHAKSDWSQAGQRDFDRALNRRGHRDAPRMGRWLQEQGVIPNLMISSPAERAWQTAVYYAEALGLSEDALLSEAELYEASPRIVLRIIHQLPNTANVVLLFGHNPTFTHMAEYLSGSIIGNIPTSGIVRLDFTISKWVDVVEHSGKVTEFFFPKKFFEDAED